MMDLLTDKEKEIMFLLIQGHNFKGISDYTGIDYSTLVILKNRYLKN